jgi:hypothetical protein
MTNDTVLFADDASVLPNGPERRVWVIGIVDPTSAAGRGYPGAYTMSAHVVDCAKITDAVALMYVYASDGQILAQQADPYGASPIAPETAGEDIYRYVCKGQTVNMGKLHSVEDVKAVGRRFFETRDKLEAQKH